MSDDSLPMPSAGGGLPAEPANGRGLQPSRTLLPIIAAPFQALVDEDADPRRVDGRGEILLPWPTCPSCQRSRVTQCPYCGTTGEEFPRAAPPPRLAGETPETDGEPEATPERLHLVCGTCDEPFYPAFARRCAWCEHDFGEGLEFEPRPTVKLVRADGLNREGWLLLAGMLGICGLIFGYFAWLTW